MFLIGYYSQYKFFFWGGGLYDVNKLLVTIITHKLDNFPQISDMSVIDGFEFGTLSIQITMMY